MHTADFKTTLIPSAPSSPGFRGTRAFNRFLLLGGLLCVPILARLPLTCRTPLTVREQFSTVWQRIQSAEGANQKTITASEQTAGARPEPHASSRSCCSGSIRS